MIIEAIVKIRYETEPDWYPEDYDALAMAKCDIIDNEINLETCLNFELVSAEEVKFDSEIVVEQKNDDIDLTYYSDQSNADAAIV